MLQREPHIPIDDLGRISAPTLVVMGDDDLMSVEHSAALFRAIPNSELAVVSGASHAVVIEKPELLNRIVLDFLENEPVPTMMPVRRPRPVRRCSSRTGGPCGSVPASDAAGADFVDVELFARTGHVPGCLVDRPWVHAHDPASDDAQHGAAEPARLLGCKPRNDRRRVRGSSGAIARGRGRHLSPGYDIVVRVVSPVGRRKRGAQVRSFCFVSGVDHEVRLPADDRENGSLKCTLSRAFQRIWTDGHGHDHGSDLQRCLPRIWPDIVRPLF